MRRFPKILVKSSVWINRYVFCGDPNQAFCARCYDAKKRNPTLFNRAVCKSIDTLFFFDPKHTQNSWRQWRFSVERRKLKQEQKENKEYRALVEAGYLDLKPYVDSQTRS